MISIPGNPNKFTSGFISHLLSFNVLTEPNVGEQIIIFVKNLNNFILVPLRITKESTYIIDIVTIF